MAANDSALSCGSDLSFWDLVAAAIGKEASGKKYLRTHKVTAVAGSKGITCGNGLNSPDEIQNELKNMFCLDANGDVALRVTQTT